MRSWAIVSAVCQTSRYMSDDRGASSRLRIILAEYAMACGMGGTCQVEGTAMLAALAGSFERMGHHVDYPTSGPQILAGRPHKVAGQEDFARFLRSAPCDAGLVIAPDELAPEYLEILEARGANLGADPEAARLCADKLECTRALARARVPVADLVEEGESPPKGCQIYVIKPRFGCGSEDVRISSFCQRPEGFIATRYVQGISLSASFICGDGFLPLTINRQLIEMDKDGFTYQGSQVPYPSPRADEIWDVARRAASALGLRGYAGIDMVVGDLPRVVDVNARPTTSIIGICRVMKEELADLIIKARLGGLPESVTIEGQATFQKRELACIRSPDGL